MIYILDNDPAKSAEYLDDRSLDVQIQDIAQVLCNVDWETSDGGGPINWKYTKTLDSWTQWAKQCKANYLWLVKYLDNSLDERLYRSNLESLHKLYNKYRLIYEWARDNVPDLPEVEDTHDPYQIKCMLMATPLPLVIPKKYITDCGLPLKSGWIHPKYHSYRNYYQAKILSQINKGDEIIWGLKPPKITWTNRQKPDWLEL